MLSASKTLCLELSKFLVNKVLGSEPGTEIPEKAKFSDDQRADIMASTCLAYVGFGKVLGYDPKTLIEGFLTTLAQGFSDEVDLQVAHLDDKMASAVSMASEKPFGFLSGADKHRKDIN